MCLDHLLVSSGGRRVVCLFSASDPGGGVVWGVYAVLQRRHLPL
jgi:hypothetical protein